MKHHGKTGKRAGPAGYRTASTFLHRKCQQNACQKMKSKRCSKCSNNKTSVGIRPELPGAIPK